MRRKGTRYVRALGWIMVVASVLLSVLAITGFGNRDACIDAGGRWISNACDGVDRFVPVASRPRFWISMALTLGTGLLLVVVAGGQRNARRSTG
jgi:hypothetical protein